MFYSYQISFMLIRSEYIKGRFHFLSKYQDISNLICNLYNYLCI